MKREQVSEQSLEITRRMAQLTVEISQSANDTCSKLNNQEEQIDKTISTSIQIDENLTIAQKIINRMRSWFGSIKPVTKSHFKLETNQISPRRAQPTVQTLTDQSSVLDQNLDIIISNLENIKESTRTINTSLDRQNKKLDSLTQITDSNYDRIMKARKTMYEI